MSRIETGRKPGTGLRHFQCQCFCSTFVVIFLLPSQYFAILDFLLAYVLPLSEYRYIGSSIIFLYASSPSSVPLAGKISLAIGLVSPHSQEVLAFLYVHIHCL